MFVVTSKPTVNIEKKVTKFSVSFFLAPPSIRLSQVLKLNGHAVQRGHKLRVRVSLTGNPAPRVTWVKDGEVIEGQGRVVMTLSDSGEAELLIDDVEKGDAGKYQVRADNEFGSDCDEFDVFVNGKKRT